jgi:hypothetical protein
LRRSALASAGDDHTGNKSARDPLHPHDDPPDLLRMICSRAAVSCPAVGALRASSAKLRDSSPISHGNTYVSVKKVGIVRAVSG